MSGTTPPRSGRSAVDGDRASVLVISPNVPAHDYSSGDLRLFSMCRLLAVKYDVVLASMNRRPRSEDERYVRELEKVGIEVVMPRWSLRDILNRRRFGPVILEFYHTAEEYLRAIRILRPRCPILIDNVDVHFHRERLKYEVTRDPADVQKATETYHREMRMYREADCVIAVTREDAEIIRREDPSIRCEIVPNIHEIVGHDRPGDEKNVLIFVGSFYHEPNGDAIAYFCRDILPLIHRRRPDVRLRIIGSGVSGPLERFAGAQVEFVGWVPSVTPYLNSAGISVAPLRFGAGMKGKIGEAMAHGLPVVTTSVGAQGFGLTPGKNVLLGDTADAFALAVLRLLEDEALYRAMAAESIEFIRQRFTPERVAQAISSVVDGSLGREVKAIKPLARMEMLSRYALGKLRRACRFPRGWE
ncbi:MAG: glycosyltransferase family 4 protein [bacterium]